MPDRDGYIPGVPCWIDTTQPDADAAAEFYGGLFGWELEDTMPADAPGKYFMARIRGRSGTPTSRSRAPTRRPRRPRRPAPAC
jgi:predicted enzyme related to lactoylglutathione lyase